MKSAALNVNKLWINSFWCRYSAAQKVKKWSVRIGEVAKKTKQMPWWRGMANLRVVLISGLKLSVSNRFININKVVIYNLGMFLKKIRRWYQNYFYLIARFNYAGSLQSSSMLCEYALWHSG